MDQLTRMLSQVAGKKETTYIEDVFSTYLYTGNGSTQTITNGIALKGTSASTQYTASGGGGISFSVDDNYKWQYAVPGSPMRIYKQDTFSTEITLPGAGTSFSLGGSCTDSAGNNYYGIYYATGGIRYLHVIKTNSAGDTILWNRQIFAGDCFAYDIATDGTSVYFVGQTGDPDFKGVLFSLSCSTGNINWHKGLTITYGVYLYTVALDTSGNVYVGGYTGGTTGSGYGYVAKFNSGGTLQNQTNFRNSDVSVKSICIDTNGDIYLGCTNGSQSYFIRKLNSSFTEQWVRVFTPTANQATWIDIGIGTSTLTAVFTDATLNVTYAAVLDKNGNLLICNSVPGHMSIGSAAGQNRKPIYKNNKLFLLLDKIYVIDESAITTNNNLLSGGGLTISATSLAFTSDSNPSNSTWFYNTATPTLTITKSSYTPSGISVAGVEGKGGLVWGKSRSAAYSHQLWDTIRGATYYLQSQTGSSSVGPVSGVTAFNANGFSLGSNAGMNELNNSMVSWTFRKQAKFFDVVTYTGNGANRTISHNLGSVPGCIIVKRTDPITSDWQVYHRSIANTEYLVLNTTAAKATGATRWNSTTPTATEFSLGTDTTVNANTGTYVAYLFAHDAGGFGASGSDNVISCGSYTGAGASAVNVNLGYEPQYLLWKRTDSTSQWVIMDVLRGMTADGSDQILYPNLSNAEANISPTINPNATGFTVAASNSVYNASGATYIYIAIRRGPMKTPTTGTSVFDAQTTASVSSITTTNFSVTVDAYLQANRNLTAVKALFPRLTRLGLLTHSTASESSAGTLTANFGVSPQTSVERPVIGGTSTTGVLYGLVRAPGFFDVVCYTGDGVGTGKVISHNLSVVPELIITKTRNGTTDWRVWSSLFSNQTSTIRLNLSDSTFTNSWFNQLLTHGSGVGMTATQYSTATGNSEVNGNGNTYVAYLFASVPGISKVGTYTGNGSSQTINCGFTTGARFILIKRTDSTGDWYVWDSARGIVAANDPHLSLNSTAAEVTDNDSIDPDSTGFSINQSSATNINVNTATYIFLAIA